MKKLELLKKIRGIVQTTKNDFSCLVDESKFEDAIRYFDVDALKALVDDGFSIKEYEKNSGSTLHRAMYEFEKIMLLECAKYNKKNVIDFYYDEFPKIEKRNLPEGLQIYLDSAVKSLVKVMEFLYQNGADINSQYMLAPDDSSITNILFGVKQIEVMSTPFVEAVNLLDYFKNPDVINWFLNKKEFNIHEQENVIPILIESGSRISTHVLNVLLAHGLKLEEYALSDGTLISSLHEGLMFANSETKPEKMFLLYNAATYEQRTQFKSNRHMFSSEKEKVNFKQGK